MGLKGFYSLRFFKINNKKMRFYLLITFFIIGSYSYSQNISDPVQKHGKLAFEGHLLKDEHGKVVRLKGMSLFWSQWQPQFYTAQSVKLLKECWGVTLVRAAMGIENGGYLKNPEIEKAKVYRVIDAAIANGIYVIVDWHDHHAEDHLSESRVFFEEVSRKYGSYPNIIYEIYNEPLAVSWKNVLKPYHESVIAQIRMNDPDNIIVCGTPQWSQNVLEASQNPIKEFNIAYTLHFYAGTHKEELRNEAKLAIEMGLPIFVTEFGTTNADGDGKVFYKETKKWLRFMKKNDLSWCNWSLADKREASAALKQGIEPDHIDSSENLSDSGKFLLRILHKG